MRVVALRRRTQLTAEEAKEGVVERLYAPDQLNELMAESDYVVMATPWTPATDKVRSGARFKRGARARGRACVLRSHGQRRTAAEAAARACTEQTG